MRVYVFERVYDIYVGIDFCFCDSFVLINIYVLKNLFFVDFILSFFKVMEMIKS